MKEINLREFYPEIYKTDLFISLPDEVVDVLVEYQRKEVAYRRRTYRHKAFLSLDYGDDIEREAVLFTPTLQEIVERHLEEERLYQAISSLPEKQRQRVYAHYILGITLMDIAKMEGVSLHAANGPGSPVQDISHRPPEYFPYALAGSVCAHVFGRDPSANSTRFKIGLYGKTGQRNLCPWENRILRAYSKKSAASGTGLCGV